MDPAIFERARILVVDDEPQNVRYLEDVLGWAGYTRVETTSDPGAALPLFREFRPDLVILDLLMPGVDGFEVLERIRADLDEDAYLPVLVLTADTSREARRKAMNAGARDFLTKPMSPTEVRLRVRNLLEARFLYLECRRLRGDGGPEREGDSASERAEILERWARLIEYGSEEEDQHAKRVAWTAAKVADALGLPAEEVELMRDAALLHDIGKGALRAEAGLHGGGADAPEALLEHPEVGERLLAGARAPVLRIASEIAAGHHERWDGDGRPRGLAGEEIPLSARIVAVANTFDRFRYGSREEASVEEALARVEGESGRAFDPRVVRALVESHAAVRT